MKKFISEFQSDVHLQLQPWLTIRLAMFASFTRSINEPQDLGQAPARKLNGSSANTTPGSSSSRQVQQDTDLGG